MKYYLILKSPCLVLCIITIYILASCQNEVPNSSTDAISTINQLASPNLANTSSQFIHPGITVGASILDQISSETYSYRIDGYDEVIDIITNKISFPTSFPSFVYWRTGDPWTPSSRQFADDPILAYAHALKWTREGNSVDANKAIQILNGWAANFDAIRPCKAEYDPTTTGCIPGQNVPQEAKRLVAAWMAPTFAATAEIIRHYEVNGIGAGWSSNDISDFEDFLLELNDYVELIVNAVKNGSGGWGQGWHNNWGASAAYAQMAIGVFVNDNSIYENGRYTIVNKLIHNIIKPSGEVNELASRDCFHPQMSLSALTYAADIERLQGSSSIYDAHSKRLRVGWKGMAKAFDPDVFFVRNCHPGGGETNTMIYTGIEKGLNYYYTHADIEIFRNSQAPYGIPTRTFLGFTTYTDYCTNTNQSSCETLFWNLEAQQVNGTTIQVQWDTNINDDIDIQFYREGYNTPWSKAVSMWQPLISAQDKSYQIELVNGSSGLVEYGKWYFRIAYGNNRSAPVSAILEE